MNLAVIQDAPETMLLSGGNVQSRVQVAKVGKFWDPRYGKFTITRKDFASWDANFRALHLADGRAGMPVDVDHGPEKKGDTEAYGWVLDLDNMGEDGKTSTPDELWAVVEWNDAGQDAVKNKRYLYLSPSYNEAYRDETGKNWGNTMVGIALTNRPFLRMATVSLSRDTEQIVLAEGVSDSPPQMPELTKEILLATGLSDEQATTVLAADDPAKALSTAVEANKAAAAPTPPASETKNLAELAKAEGKVVLDASQLIKLTADAAAGAAAAQELHTSKFERAFDEAVENGRVLPASKSTFELAYGVQPAETIKQLGELPSVLHVTLDGETGHTASTSNATAAQRAEVKGEKFTIDDERAELDRKATELARSEGIEYEDAIERVLAEA